MYIGLYDDRDRLVQICRVGRLTQDSRDSVMQMETEAICWNSLLLRKMSLFVLFRPSTNWMRPTVIIKGNLLTQFASLNVDLIKTPSKLTH